MTSQTKTPQVPHLTPELIDWLDYTTRFPLPDPNISERMLWVGVGQRRVYENLKAAYDTQMNRGLT